MILFYITQILDPIRLLPLIKKEASRYGLQLEMGDLNWHFYPWFFLEATDLKLISKYGDKLSMIAEKNKVNLEFEAAVCGGVPIIRSLKEGLIANKIHRVFGILNGTSNYILTSLVFTS